MSKKTKTVTVTRAFQEAVNELTPDKAIDIIEEAIGQFDNLQSEYLSNPTQDTQLRLNIVEKWIEKNADKLAEPASAEPKNYDLHEEQKVEYILETLRTVEGGDITPGNLLKQCWLVMSTEDCTRITKSLLDFGAIHAIHNPRGGILSYELA